MSTLQLKPSFQNNNKNKKEDPQQEKAKRYLLTLSLILGYDPRLDMDASDLDATKTLSETLKKLSLKPGQNQGPKLQANLVDRAVNFVAALGMFLALDFSYTPEPEAQLVQDPLAWKKKNSKSLPAPARFPFFNRLTPKPAPAPANTNEQKLEEERRARLRPSFKPQSAFPK